MKQDEIAYIRHLSEKYPAANGTIMSVLLDGDLQRSTFVGTLRHLLERTIEEKMALMEENKKLLNACKAANMNLNEILFGGE